MKNALPMPISGVCTTEFQPFKDYPWPRSTPKPEGIPLKVLGQRRHALPGHGPLLLALICFMREPSRMILQDGELSLAVMSAMCPCKLT